MPRLPRTNGHARARPVPTVWGTPPYFNNAYGDYYYLRPNHYVFKLPDDITDDMATPVNCALSECSTACIAPGCALDKPWSSRCRRLGLNAVAVARDMGADKIVFDQVPERARTGAHAFGADHPLSLANLPTPEQH